MPRQCSVCAHSKREEIDAELLSGTPLRSIADRFGPSKSALIRHRQNCLSEIVNSVITAAEKKNKKLVEEGTGRILGEQERALTSGVDAISRLEGLMADAKYIQGKAERSDNYHAALLAIDKQAKLFEVVLKMMSEAREREKEKDREWEREWEELKKIIFSVFNNHPEARDEFVEKLSNRRITHFT
jgi:vacuolar-type H+-ATPase subunit H